MSEAKEANAIVQKRPTYASEMKAPTKGAKFVIPPHM